MIYAEPDPEHATMARKKNLLTRIFFLAGPD